MGFQSWASDWTMNQFAAQLQLQREKQEQNEPARVEKKRRDEERKKSQEAKAQEAKKVHDRLLPICKEHVAKGLSHVLSLSVKNASKCLDFDKPDKIQILKHVFNHPEAKSNLKKARADEILSELISSVESEQGDDIATESVEGRDGDVMAIPLPRLPGSLV